MRRNTTQTVIKSKPGYLLVMSWPMTPIGGVNEVVLNLAQHLGLRGYRPMIASPQTKEASMRGVELLTLMLNDPVMEGSTLKPLLGFLLRLPFVAWRLSRLLKRLEVRVVNPHYPSLSAIHFVVLRKLGLFRGPILLSFHGADLSAVRETRGMSRRAWRYLIANVDGNVACSEALRQSLLSFLPDARVTTIHNGSDRDLFLNSDRPMNARRRVILQVAAFERKKGQDVLLRAFQSLRQIIPDAYLILVGQRGPLFDEIKQLIAELRLEDCVEMQWEVPHEVVPKFMKRADIFVLPSRSEPFGLVLLEAGASLLPVIATRVGGIPELLENEVTALLVDPDDVRGLEDAIRTLMQDESKATRLAQAWHKKSAEWTWERTCDGYLRLSGNPR